VRRVLCAITRYSDTGTSFSLILNWQAALDNAR
jgi:hypothetical protein